MEGKEKGIFDDFLLLYSKDQSDDMNEVDVANVSAYHGIDASIHLKSQLDFQAKIIFDGSLCDSPSYDNCESYDVLYDGHDFPLS